MLSILIRDHFVDKEEKALVTNVSTCFNNVALYVVDLIWSFCLMEVSGMLGVFCCFGVLEKKIEDESKG